MIERYEDGRIKKIWSDENKTSLWQETELAMIQAQEELSLIPPGVYSSIRSDLLSNPIEIKYWKERDKILHHDLNAFLEERLRFIREALHQYFHKKFTSYDTEEPAFGRMLYGSVKVVFKELDLLTETLTAMARRYRFVIMNGRTHGQEAELQTFGKRCLTWLKDILFDSNLLYARADDLKNSKLSGAIGNYGAGIDPRVEEVTLKILGLRPYYGATQIMPREIYAPTAQALCQIVSTLNKIALSIRLGARSGRPIFHEPFSKMQKGSSAMPHKRNPIKTEQIQGMSDMANGYLLMIMNNIKTWEERAIEQSCVERIAWPDLFHVTVHSLKVMNSVLSGLVIYPDNMMAEIIDSRGCYASSEVKEFLKKHGVEFGLGAEDSYRIVQLAAFNAFAVSDNLLEARQKFPGSFEEADELLGKFDKFPSQPRYSIQEIIQRGVLFPLPEQLQATEETVAKWNTILQNIFSDPESVKKWAQLFQPSYLLKNEQVLYQKILGE